MKFSNTAILFFPLAASLAGYSAFSPLENNKLRWCCGLILSYLFACRHCQMLVEEKEI
jgi:hypothetical protein